jgi:hypothetical protein
MYLDDSEIERDVLRQGDIVENVHFLGALNLNCINVIDTPNSANHPWFYNEKAVLGPAMVLSHSCEIDSSNGIKLTSIILAPLRDIDKATSNDKRDELIGSNIITDTSKASFLKYFYIEPDSHLKYSNGAVVDFSKCFSLKKDSYEHLLKNKVLQLTEKTMQNMALKLAFYYYRTTAQAA